MLFNKIVGCVAVLATAVVASPIESRAVSKPFKLVTSSANPAHNGLYVESYHTGAGTSDPVLTTTAANSPAWVLNGTYVNANLGGNTPFGFDMAVPLNYANWETVTIDAGYGSDQFSINGTQLVWNGDGFTGWLACDWWHGNAPQLFWIFGPEGPTTLPCSCSTVKLNVKYT